MRIAEFKFITWRVMIAWDWRQLLLIITT
jgi:hypothetical protein